MAELTVAPDIAAHRHGEPPRDRHVQIGRRIGLRLEHLIQGVVAEARSSICDIEAHGKRIAFARADIESDRPFLRRGKRGLDQAHEHLADPVRVTKNEAWRIRRHVDPGRKPFQACACLQLGRGGSHQPVQI